MSPRLLGLTVLFLLLAACGRSSPSERPQGPRFISLAPAITATMHLLEAEGQLVGRSDWCTGSAAPSLPVLGSALTPDLERIAALQPATVLVDGSAATRLDDLRAVATVEVLPWLSAEEVAASVRRLGRLTGRTEAADRMADELDATFGEPPAEGPRVLLALGSDGLDAGEIWFGKRNSLHGSVLHAAGARNAVDEDITGAPTLSLEGLIQRDPDAIIVLTAQDLDEAGNAAAIAAWSRLTPLRAVQNGRIGVVHGEVAMATDPRVVQLVALVKEELTRLQVELP